MRTFFLAIVSLCVTIAANAFTIKEVNVFSESMKKDVPVTVVFPDDYDSEKLFPVVYLLHGYSDNYKTWTERTDVEELSDLYKVIIVMPDGGHSSWYFDSPFVPDYQYETFVSAELVNYIDSNFKTIKDRSGRAITGLSMGGHGALHTAFKHQEVFGSAGSTSGGVDFRPFPTKWHIAARIGSYEEYPDNWEKSTVINLTHLLTPGSLNIIIDCGVDDFFYGVNCNLHEKLLKEGIPHDFYTRPGGHNWAYWGNSIKYQMLFFDACFGKINSNES